MPDDPLLRIGAFSRASWLSVKALRTYHEVGLLVPAEVDPATGYRSYAASQLIDAAVIRRLRHLDVPLDVIRVVLDARDPAVTKKMLAEHATVLAERLAAIQRAIDDLYLAVDVPAVHTPVHRRREPARVVFAVSGTVSEVEFEGFLDRAHSLVLDAAVASGAVVDGPFGGCYPPLLDDDAQEVMAFLPVVNGPLLAASSRSSGVRIDELPGTDVAVLAHVGSYDALEDSYRRLGAWVAANDEPRDMSVRELYHVGAAETDDAGEYLTEICWPIRGVTRS
jgi:DNA-binding transcriptional MerR regulator